MLRVFLGVVLLASLLAPLGCGESKPKQYPVSGKVIVEGKPLADVGIFFVPAIGGDKAQNFSGKTGSDGSYSLSDSADQSSGALPGKYKVVLALAGDAFQKQMMASMTAPGQGGPPQITTPFPKEYQSAETSPKEVEVKAESNTIDITIP